jgi:ribosome-associated heat shock protein Hsp15
MRGKAHREIHVGDHLVLTLGPGTRREVLVRGLADRSIPKAQARMLYEDVTPAPSPEVAEARRLDRLMAPRFPSARPDKRERRDRRRQKGW